MAESREEWRRTDPDIVVYLPHGAGRGDTDNEHFLVFEAPSGDELLALWTQSSCEGRGDNHLVLARSRDGARWSEPMLLAGSAAGTCQPQASWGFPVVADSGRIYCFYTRETDRHDNSRQGSGTMGCLLSDDNGHAWKACADIPMPRTRFDHPDPDIPKNWIAWQKPIRDRNGRWLSGYTLCTSRARLSGHVDGWWQADSRCMFMRFENLDEGQDPADLVLTWLPVDEQGVTVPFPVRWGWSCAQEPSIVLLPDGRLFATMRTMTGYVWYTVSDDDGASWRTPEVLRARDGGTGIRHPLSPCPTYALEDGRYLLVTHNNRGCLDGHDQLLLRWTTNHLNFIRNPTFVLLGEFRPQAHQPIWFSKPLKVLDTDDVPVGPKGTAEVGTYTSLTEWRGTRILWYPDRKYYLLGKALPDSLLARLDVPV